MSYYETYQQRKQSMGGTIPVVTSGSYNTYLQRKTQLSTQPKPTTQPVQVTQTKKTSLLQKPVVQKGIGFIASAQEKTQKLLDKVTPEKVIKGLKFVFKPITQQVQEGIQTAKQVAPKAVEEVKKVDVKKNAQTAINAFVNTLPPATVVKIINKSKTEEGRNDLKNKIWETWKFISPEPLFGIEEGTVTPEKVKTKEGRKEIGEAFDKVLTSLQAVGVPMATSYTQLPQFTPGLEIKSAIGGAGIGLGISSGSTYLAGEKQNWWNNAFATILGAYFGLMKPTNVSPKLTKVSNDKDILQKYGINNKEDYKAWVKQNHPDLFPEELRPQQTTKLNEVNTAIADLAKSGSGIEGKVKLPTTIPDAFKWADNLWLKITNPPSKTGRAIVPYVEQVINPGEYTSSQLAGKIITSDLAKTAEGKQIMKVALEAQQTGQNVVIEKAGNIGKYKVGDILEWKGKGYKEIEKYTIKEVSEEGITVSDSKGYEVMIEPNEIEGKKITANINKYRNFATEDYFGNVSGSGVELSDKGVYAELTPKQLEVLRNEVKNIPFTKGDTPHLSPINRLQKSGLKEVSLEEIKSMSPNLTSALKAKPPQAGKGVSVKGKEELVMRPTKAREVKEVVKEAEKLELYPSFLRSTWQGVKGYNIPKISKTDLRQVFKSSKEFKENPILTVVRGRAKEEARVMLQFIGDKVRFRMNPDALQLKSENLKIGQKIRVDEESLAVPGKVQQMRVYKGGETYASRGIFADLDNLTKKLDKENLKVVEFPEMVRIAKEITGKTPTVTASKRGKYLGVFKSKPGVPGGDIILKAEGFKTAEQASKLLSHEIGHATDFSPELTMKRGNLVARIASLQRYMKNIYGNLNNKEIKKELMDLSAKWRPVENGKGNASDLVGDKYRSSPQELYADAISVLFNDPARLKQEASQFYKGFFDYLDKKPEAKAIFEETWALLNKSDEEIFNVRNAELNKSFEKAEQVFATKELEKAKQKSSLMYQLKLLFDDKNTPIISKINQARKIHGSVPSELNPDYALKGINYYEGELKNYINKNFQPVFSKAQSVPDGWNDLGKIVFYERVINERGAMANPQGYNQETAQFQLDQMKKSMSKESWDTLQEAKVSFRQAVQNTVDLAEKSGFYTPEMIQTMKANPAYATYQVIDYLDTYISSKVYHSVGTLKDIANPATSTVMKLISTHKAIKRNEAKKVGVDFMNQYFPKEIEKARTKWNGKFMEVKDPTDPTKGLIITIEGGKPQGYYLDKDVADVFNYTSNRTLEVATKLSRALTQSRFYRPLFTSMNLGFQTFNFVRDFMRYWKNVPDRTLGEALTSLPRAFLRYGQAVRPSIARVANKPSTLIQEMEDANILGLTYNDMYSEGEIAEMKQIERILQKTGVISKARKFRALRPFEWVIERVEDVGNFIETLPKVAGYIELKGKMPEKELAQFIRTSIGSPDFRTGGTLTPVSNNIFLFSNAIKEGIKTDIGIATKKSSSRSGFWWKTVISNFLPKIIMAGMALGYFGKQLQIMMNKASEYDKTNYTIIPLGIDEKGDAVYLRVPTDETGRFLGGLLWKILPHNKDTSLIQDISEMFSFGAGQFPNLTPSFTGAGALMQYLSGKNPYDSFRGRYVIPDTEFKAGMKYSLPIFMSWLLKNQGLGIIFPSYKPDDPTELNKILNAPFISNILGRWIRVSSYGEKEQLTQISKSMDSQNAVRLLEERKKVDKAIQEYKANPSRKGEIERQLVRDIVGKPPYKDERKTKETNTIKKFRIGVLRGENNVYMNSLIDANTNAEKVKLLVEMKKKLSEEEFLELFKTAKKEKVISDNVIKDFRKQS